MYKCEIIRIIKKKKLQNNIFANRNFTSQLIKMITNVVFNCYQYYLYVDSSILKYTELNPKNNKQCFTEIKLWKS